MSVLTVFRLIFSGLCALGGISAFIAFLVLKNYPAAVLSVLMGVTEGVITFMHILYIKRRVHEWYSPRELRQICRFGITLLFVGMLSTIYFATMEGITKRNIMPIASSLVLPLIWSIIIIRTAIILIYYSIRYKIVSEYEPISGNNVEEGQDQEQGSVFNGSTEIQEHEGTASLPKIDEESSVPSDSQSEAQIIFERETNVITEESDKRKETPLEIHHTLTDTNLVQGENKQAQAVKTEPSVIKEINKETHLIIQPTLIDAKLVQRDQEECKETSETEPTVMKEMQIQNAEKQDLSELHHPVVTKEDTQISEKGQKDLSESMDIVIKNGEEKQVQKATAVQPTVTQQKQDVTENLSEKED